MEAAGEGLDSGKHSASLSAGGLEYCTERELIYCKIQMDKLKKHIPFLQV